MRISRKYSRVALFASASLFALAVVAAPWTFDAPSGVLALKAAMAAEPDPGTGGGGEPDPGGGGGGGEPDPGGGGGGGEPDPGGGGGGPKGNNGFGNGGGDGSPNGMNDDNR